LNKHVALLTNFQLVPYSFKLAYKSLHFNRYYTHVQTNNCIQQEAVRYTLQETIPNFSNFS